MRKVITVFGFVIFAFTSFAQRKIVPVAKLNGNTIYVNNCMKCHQRNGEGAQNMIPPLIKNEYVLGPKQKIIRIVLKGLQGEIKVNGDIFWGEMPPQANLKDEEISAVLTYIRNNFGNKASAITAAEVKKERAVK